MKPSGTPVAWSTASNALIRTAGHTRARKSSGSVTWMNMCQLALLDHGAPSTRTRPLVLGFSTAAHSSRPGSSVELRGRPANEIEIDQLLRHVADDVAIEHHPGAEDHVPFAAGVDGDAVELAAAGAVALLLRLGHAPRVQALGAAHAALAPDLELLPVDHVREEAEADRVPRVCRRPQQVVAQRLGRPRGHHLGGVPTALDSAALGDRPVRRARHELVRAGAVDHQQRDVVAPHLPPSLIIAPAAAPAALPNRVDAAGGQAGGRAPAAAASAAQAQREQRWLSASAGLPLKASRLCCDSSSAVRVLPPDGAALCGGPHAARPPGRSTFCCSAQAISSLSR